MILAGHLNLYADAVIAAGIVAFIAYVFLPRMRP